MPSHRGWWLALLVVQIVIALSGFSIGLGVVLGIGTQIPSPDFFANRSVRGFAILLLGAFTGATAFCLARGHRSALALSASSAMLLLAWMHRVSVALGQHTAIGVFFMILGVLELVFVLLVLGVQHGVPAPIRPEPVREPVPRPLDDLDA